MTNEQLREVGLALNKIGIENIMNVILIKNNTTNGEVIKALFPYVEVKDNCKEFYSVNIENLLRDKSLNTIGFTKDWWNSPYKGGEQNG